MNAIFKVLSSPGQHIPDRVAEFIFNMGDVKNASVEDILKVCPKEVCIEFALSEVERVLPIWSGQSDDDSPIVAVEAARNYINGICDVDTLNRARVLINLGKYKMVDHLEDIAWAAHAANNCVNANGHDFLCLNVASAALFALSAEALNNLNKDQCRYIDDIGVQQVKRLFNLIDNFDGGHD